MNHHYEAIALFNYLMLFSSVPQHVYNDKAWDFLSTTAFLKDN